jgi:prephenate dehydratase
VTAPADVAYLGPSGTFTEQAVRQVVGDGLRAVPVGTVEVALARVHAGQAHSAVVPLENSVEGSVSATLDALIHGDPLTIVRELHVAVRFALLARPGTALAQVRRVATHPHAAAQTRLWLAEHLPHAEVLPEASTARAAELVARGDYDGAVAAPLAAGQHGLVLVADDIADRAGAVTRFVQLARPGTPPPPPTGADTTTLVAFIRHNHPGALLALLEQFSVRGVDLSRLESRPTGEGLGQYCFAIDADAHVAEPRMAEVLTGLHRTCLTVRYLGSYPRADARPGTVPPEAAASAYADAGAWLRSLRGQG